MNQFCKMNGILRQFSVARTPQQNGVAGRKSSGPDWLFDIGALTRTMNYEPIVAGTQSNGFPSTKASDNSSYEDGSKPSSDDGKKVDEDPRKENELDLPNEKRAIGTKWVFRNKKDERGIVIRNKARLVAQGYIQEEGIDYDKVFAPVARMQAIRLFIAYASFKDFMVYQMNVKSDFLYEKIKEEVYVYQPPGFEDPNFPDRVYKVEKALSGLH
nr:putative ribonuclease H-like domain-containing protein [Tanacetum cinerariifolium]